MEAVDKAIETSGAALREQLISRFHEDSARANKVSVPHHRATVAITAFEHVRGVDKVYVDVVWAFYSSWVLVTGRSTVGLYASMVVKRGGRTVIDPTTAHFYEDTLPVLSAKLRVRSFQDAKRSMRSFYALDTMVPSCNRDFQMIMSSGTILDLRSGCSYICYAGTPPHRRTSLPPHAAQTASRWRREVSRSPTQDRRAPPNRGRRGARRPRPTL